MSSLDPRIALAALATTIPVAGIGAGTAAARPAVTNPADMPTLAQVKQPNRVMDMEVFPTGDGPADEEVCQGFENRLFAISLDMKQAMKEGDGDHAVELSDAMDNVEDMATDAGCAIIY